MRTTTRLSGWRRVANAMWRAPDDPQIFGALDVDAESVLAFIARTRAAGHHVTPTHVVGRAVAHVLREVPQLNVRIRRGRVRPRRSIDVKAFRGYLAAPDHFEPETACDIALATVDDGHRAKRR